MEEGVDCVTPFKAFDPESARYMPLSPNNPLQRSGHDKVHAPDCRAGVRFSGYAPQVRRAAAERGRYASVH
jgi:hypothetical protein